MLGDSAFDDYCMPGWRQFPHDADIGVCGYGPGLSQAFEQAALAMTAAITDPAKVRPCCKITIICNAPDVETLLVDWLNRIVFEMSSRKMLFSRFKVFIGEGNLRGSAWGEKIDVNRHEPAVEVKGATYTALSVTQNPEGCWRAQCVIDV